MSEVQKFAIKDIKPNPFRHLDRYPINREKVEALKESLRTTGFWDNIVARKINGSPELAYGHHRLIALEEEYGAGHKINLIIQDLSNETMLQIMAGENREEWRHDASVEHETVRAVVEALGQGDIELPAPKKKTPRKVIRYAPSFIRGADVPHARGEHPYSAETIADFLGRRSPSGRPQAKLQYALDALELMERDILSQRDFTDLTVKQAEAVVTETNKARSRHQDDNPEEWAAKVGKGVAEELKSGVGVSSKDYIARKIDPSEVMPPDINEAAKRLADKFNRVGNGGTDPLTEQLEEIIKHIGHADPVVRKELAKTLDLVSRRTQKYARQVEVADADTMRDATEGGGPNGGAANVSKNGDNSEEEEYEKVSDEEAMKMGFLIRAGEALRYAVYDGPPDAVLADAASQTTKAWATIAAQLREPSA